MPRPLVLVARLFGGLIGLVPVGLPAQTEGPARPWRFDFGAAAVAPEQVGVTPEQRFDVERGYGFEPGANVQAIDRGGADPLRRDLVAGTGPFLFSVVVPEGNHRVTVWAGDPAQASALTVKAESRRLMVEHLVTAPGEIVERTFTVNVRNAQLPPPPLNAPGGTAVVLNDREAGVWHWDDKLTLEFNGARPSLVALRIEPVDVPTVYLIGDSTVTDQPGEPNASWGQMLPRFLGPGVAVANHAESGETMKSFITGLRLAKVLSRMKRGDFLFIQFGHNDSKAQWPQTYVEANSTYRAYLRVLVAEARLRGATPVLVTSVQRRQWDEQGRIRNSHGDYPAAVRAVAAEENVPLIDLERASVAFYEALGPEEAPRAFADEGRDATHHNNYGAYQLARAVVEGIRAQVPALAAHVVADAGRFDPAQPDDPTTFSLPASPRRASERPRGN